MKNKNTKGFKDYKLHELTKEDNINSIFCPHIQRDFVWGKEKIEQLFDSIYRGFFIGMFWFWKTPKKEVDSIEFFELPMRFDGIYDQIHPTQRNPIAVIDGQQRLTSLKIGIMGSFKKQKLYFNTSKEPKQLFKFFSEKEISKDNQEWYLVSDIFKQRKKNLPSKAKEFKNIFYDTKIMVYWIPEKTLIKVTEIFRRVNKGGTPLTNSQELMSRLASTWKESRDEFRRVRDEVKENAITITNDFIVKTCLFCTGKAMKIKILDNDNSVVIDIQKNWTKISQAIISMSKEIKKFGFDDSNIIAYNSLIPLVYIWYKRWNEYKNEELISKYLYRAILLRRFSKSADTVLEKARKLLEQNGFPKLIKEYQATEGDINKILALEKNIYTKLTLKLLYGYGSSSKYLHDDHMHPKKVFINEKEFLKRMASELKGKYSKKQAKKHFEIWREQYNKLPNLRPLLDSENKRKSGESLEKWALRNKNIFKKAQNFLEEDTSLKLCKFKNFYKIRTKKMRDKLRKELKKN